MIVISLNWKKKVLNVIDKVWEVLQKRFMEKFWFFRGMWKLKKKKKFYAIKQLMELFW